MQFALKNARKVVKMSFSNMMGILQEKDKGKIVFVKSGVFYIAVGRDAVFLNKELGLKCVCFKKQVCKVGVPEGSIEKYLTKLDEKNIGYIVYDFDNKKEELLIRYKKDGKYHNEMKTNKNCLECKGYRDEVIRFNLKQEEYIMWLYEKLRTGTYKHGGYSVFYVTEPKLRKIEKSRYIDRIVHRFVVDNFLKEYFEKCFIYHTYACIKNRGMHKATLDVQKAMKKCKNVWGEYYILKMDVRKYFDNIDKDILLNILKRKITDKKLLWLLKEIIYSNCTKEELQKENIKRKGLPIGNYTSQLLANIYLNEIDQYIKNTLRIKYYFRYLDDSIVFVKTKEEAKMCLQKIERYLKDNLGLELNEKTKKYLAGHMGYIKYADIYNLSEKLFYIE